MAVVLKKYNQYSTGVPTTANIVLFANASTGLLNKVTLENLFKLVKLGDDAAGISEPNVLTSDRFINQDGNDVTFVGEHDSEVSTITIDSESHIILKNINAVAGDTSELIISANHNASTGGSSPFLQYYPGDTNLPANNLLVPYLSHMFYGADGTGFNEAPQATYVYAFGVNMNRPGATYDSSRGDIGIAMEHYYDAMDDTTGRQEFHIVHNLPGGLSDGSGGRLFTYQGFEDELLGSSAAFQTGRDDVSQESFALRTQEGAARVTFDWGAKYINLFNSVGIFSRVNNVPILQQSNFLGNSAISLIYANADDNIVVGNGFVFDTNGGAIHRSTSSLNLGTEVNAIANGVIVTSTTTDLFRVKQTGVADTLLISKDATNFYLGRVAGASTALAIANGATSNSLYIGADGISAGGQAILGRITAVSPSGGTSFAAYNLATDGNTAYYAAGTTTGSIYAFKTDLTADDKVIGLLLNYSGDVELRLEATTAAETAVVKFVDATNSWSVGVDKTTDSLFIYNGGDKLAGGASVMEFTKAGKIKPTLPVYADDATAGVGGLAANEMYKTATGEVRIKT